MFKAVIAASHPEFSSIRQQVLCVYFMGNAFISLLK